MPLGYLCKNYMAQFFGFFQEYALDFLFHQNLRQLRVIALLFFPNQVLLTESQLKAVKIPLEKSSFKPLIFKPLAVGNGYICLVIFSISQVV